MNKDNEKKKFKSPTIYSKYKKKRSTVQVKKKTLKLIS